MSVKAFIVKNLLRLSPSTTTSTVAGEIRVDSSDSNKIKFHNGTSEDSLAMTADVTAVSTGLSDHLADTADAHDASAISVTPSGNLSSTDVQAALLELQGDINTDTTLADGKIYIGDATDTAVEVTPSGDVTISNTGTTAISSGVIVDADVNVSAAIARTKLASGTADHVLINSGAGVMSGEAQLAISRGGTGQATANTAFNALAPSQATHSGKFLTTDGSDTSWASLPPTGANTALSNLTTTSVNESLVPSSDNTKDLGSSTTRWANAYATNAAFGDVVTGGDGSLFLQKRTSSSLFPHTATSLIVAGFGPAASTYPVVLETSNDAVANASATKNVEILTGNKTAGTGNSGDVIAQTGTSAGGTRGGIYIKEGSEGTSGHILTSSGTGGKAVWAANTAINAIAVIGAVPNANGLTVTGTTLNLEPASASFGGVLTTGTQTVTGAKTFDTSVLSPIVSTNSANPSAAGVFRLSNNQSIGWRNAANSGNLLLTAGVDDVLISSNQIRAPSFQAGTTTAAGGAIKLENNFTTGRIAWRNSANSADVAFYLDATDTFIAASGMRVTGNFIVWNGFELRLNGATAGYAGFKSPATGPSLVYTLPTADGTSGQVLSTNASAVLSWVTRADTSLSNLTTTAITQDLLHGTAGTAWTVRTANNGAGNSGDLTVSTGTATGTRGVTHVTGRQLNLTPDSNINVPTTVTAGGVTGNQTIDKVSGTVNFAAAATTLTVTNSLVTANSIVFTVVRTDDATATIKNVVPGAGSFVITLTAAATAETSVGFFVFN